MSNKNYEIIKKKIEDLGLTIGCYDPLVEKLNKENLNKILSSIEEEYTDVDIKINEKDYVVEIATVDNEKDLQILSRSEYIRRYGSSRYDEE